ncbi:MAG: amidase [Dehalococcoidia bacterium]|nr:amidase [Dehalococcoidia bacterium]
MNVWMDDASSLADAVRRREVRAADALEASLDAIQRSELNTVVTLDAEGARRQAEVIDERLMRGEDPGLFAGVPLLVKDVEDAAGMPTSHGSLVFKDKIAERDSTHVERLRAAGAVIVGKAATSEFGFVAYTATKLHGVTRNPWNLERTPAGSSGGPAAAVSGGLVPLATAGDGGGSIRIPASYCGLVGMKGTFGRIPRGPSAGNGQLAAVKGTVARSVRDAARWYDVTCGYDPRDPFSLPRIDGWEERLGNSDLRGLRVAVAPDLGNAVVHPEVARVVRDAADVLVEAAGLRRMDLEVKVPENGLAWARAGLPSLIADLKDYWPDCKEDLTLEIRFAMEASPQYRAWHGAEVETFRIEMNEAMADLFEQVDILLCATSPMEPFAAEGPMPYQVGEVAVSPYNAGALTIPANLSGYPAISIPAGLSSGGLPIGLQAYARRHEDALLLTLAHTMERARPWPLVAPGAPI